MKNRKLWLILSGAVSVLMVIIIIVTIVVTGVKNPVRIIAKTTEEPVVKDFVEGEDTVIEINKDETVGLIIDNDNALNSDKNTTDDSPSNKENTPEYLLNKLEYANRYFVGELPSKAIIERSRLREGNKVRLANKINAFMKGGNFKVGYIGGSITAGAGAEQKFLSYTSLTTTWFTETFPKAEFTTVNAGIGATGSYIGVHRVDEDLLSQKPDIVFVEFAVNDSSSDSVAKLAYESLIRKIWNSENKPAIILLESVAYENGSFISNQDSDWALGEHYDLPMISFGDAVRYAVNEGATLGTLLGDYIHPTTNGHKLYSQLIQYYLYDVVTNTVNGKIKGSESDFTQPRLVDFYSNAKLLQPKDIKAKALNGFTETAETVTDFKGAWQTSGNGAVIEFEVTGKNIGILFSVPEENGGTAKVYVDGKVAPDLDANGNYGYPRGTQVFSSSNSVKRNVKIVVQGGGMNILGLLVS